MDRTNHEKHLMHRYGELAEEIRDNSGDTCQAEWLEEATAILAKMADRLTDRGISIDETMLFYNIVKQIKGGS